MAVILIFTCLVTPYRIALIEVDKPGWMWLNYFIDFSFFVDMIFIFNSAYYDEEFNEIQDRKVIAKLYLKGWFTIDLFAILPFDLMFGGGGLNQIVRITRISKMYKLVKLTRLVRILKIFKESNKMFKYMENYLNIGVGFQRLLGFVLSFFMIIHIVSCLWIMTVQFNESSEGTWMEGDIFEMNPPEKYLTSIYFTVTTITTVGYGDVTISTKFEKIFCIITMLTGVIAFSFASGSLASIL